MELRIQAYRTHSKHSFNIWMAIKVRVAFDHYSHHTIWYQNKQSKTKDKSEIWFSFVFMRFAINFIFAVDMGAVVVVAATAIKIKMRPIDIIDMEVHKTYIHKRNGNNTYSKAVLRKHIYNKEYRMGNVNQRKEMKEKTRLWTKTF